MRRAALEATLETADRHIAEGQKHIEQQRQIVGRLEQMGRGTSYTATIARELLLSMQRVQRAHLSHREQVRAELARLDGIDKSPAIESASGDSALAAFPSASNIE